MNIMRVSKLLHASKAMSEHGADEVTVVEVRDEVRLLSHADESKEAVGVRDDVRLQSHAEVTVSWKGCVKVSGEGAWWWRFLVAMVRDVREDKPWPHL